jgi:membrane-associated phospholipid phosphatase
MEEKWKIRSLRGNKMKKQRLFILRFEYLVILYIFFCPNMLYANDNLLCTTYNTTSEDVSSYPKFVWQNKDYAAGALVLIGGSLLIDKSVRTYVINHQNNTAKNLADDIKPFGNGYVIFPAVSILSLYGYLTDNATLMDASLTSLESGAVAGIITLGLKSIVGRARPYHTSSNLTFKPFNINNTYASFPSGDATVAWSMITPYAVYYHEPLLYTIPVLVDFERIYKNKHWTSDVITGSVIGFSVGYLFSENHLKLSKTVSFETDGRDIVLNVRF